MKKLLIVCMLIAVPTAAQEATPDPPLSEQAIEAAKLRAQAERWGKIADLSLHTWGLISASSLAMAGIEDQHPRRTRAINLMWVGGGAVWLVARLRERHLRGRVEALEADRQPQGRVAGSR